MRRLLRWGLAAGLVEHGREGVRLSPAGLTRAARIVRNHRLWELFLISGADIAPDHVDRDADSIEHFLTPEIIRELEAQLEGAGRLPQPTDSVPLSPHEISAHAAPRPAGEEPAHG